MDFTLWIVFLIWSFVHFVTALFLHLVEVVDASNNAPSPKTDGKASAEGKGVTQDLYYTETSFALVLEEKEELNTNIS